MPIFLIFHSFYYNLGFIDHVNVNRRRRTKFTNEQLAVLEQTFTHGSKFPSPGERMLLETRTGLSKEKISVWFQNRRAKEKREKGQEGTSKETEESTTESEENETGDEMQLHVCDKTPEEENGVGAKRLHVAQDLSTSSCFEALKENGKILYPENKPKENYMVETSSDDNEPDISNIYNVNKRDDSTSQNKRRKFLHAGQEVTNPGMTNQSYPNLEYRLFGES